MKTSTMNVNNVVIDIEQEKATPTSIWERRFQMHEEYTRGVEDYKMLTEQSERYEAFKERIAVTLGLMAENVDDMMQHGLEIGEDGTLISLHLHLLVADLDEESKAKRQETKFARRNALTTINGILDDINAEEANSEA